MKLVDIIKKANGSLDIKYITGVPFSTSEEPEVPALMTFLINGLSSIGVITFNDFNDVVGNFISNILWCQYIVPTFMDCEYCVEVENDETKTVEQFCKGLIAILNRTGESYILKIDALEVMKEHLLDDIRTATESFNQDTPQNELLADFDNEHTSFRSKSVVSTSAGTPAARLAEINLNIANTFEEWLDSFKGLFLMGD